MTKRRERGSYAKGVAKREEILTQALEVIAQQGYRGASIKEIAQAVGLSQAGLLHYFESKEHLFVEVLRKRDEVDSPALVDPGVDPDTGADLFFARFLATVRHNTEVPGLVQLFSQLAVDAADPQHPAHPYFVDRSARFRDLVIAHLRLDPADAASDAETQAWARILQAVSDGLQLQWMLDPGVDMAGTLERLLDAIPVAQRTIQRTV